MHNIKEGHDVKPSVGDMFVNYDEAFKMRIQNAGNEALSYVRNFSTQCSSNSMTFLLFE
jgi:hypothetical protein